MSKERDLNKDIERFVCEKFLELCNKEINCDIQIERAGNPNKKEPDFMCSNGVAVEVTGIYASKEDGKMSNRIIHGKRGQMKDYIKTSNAQDYVVSKIVEKHNKHNGGNYSGCPDETEIYLVCNGLPNHSVIGLGIEEEVDGIREKLDEKLSSGGGEKCFDGIFLLLNDGKYSIRQLWQPGKRKGRAKKG